TGRCGVSLLRLKFSPHYSYNEGVEHSQSTSKGSMKKNLIIALVLYIASSAVSYGVCSSMNTNTTTEIVDPSGSGEELEPEGTLLTIEPGEPKDQVCPLNGQLYTETERDAWEKRRPLA